MGLFCSHPNHNRGIPAKVKMKMILPDLFYFSPVATPSPSPSLSPSLPPLPTWRFLRPSSPLKPVDSNGERRQARQRRRWQQPSATVLPRRRPFVLLIVVLIVVLVGVILCVILVVDSVSVVVSLSLSLAALRHSLVLSLHQLVVACHHCCPIPLRCPLALSSGQLVVV